MPRRTLRGGLQINLTIDEHAYNLLQRYAPTGKSYGRFVTTLLEKYDEAQGRDELRERLARLEEQLAAR
jgi:hypothetical protein